MSSPPVRKYFNLNIRHQSPTWSARCCLEERLIAPIFYGACTIDEIRAGVGYLKGKAKREPQEFVNVQRRACSSEHPFQPIFVTIDEGRVWIYRPMGDPEMMDLVALDGRAGKSEDQVKAFRIEHYPLRGRNAGSVTRDVGVATAAVPLILASMKVNQAFSRSTFSEIKPDRYQGNIGAIKYLMGDVDDGFSVDPLDCLSSLELETLVAKLFEAAGCFVPAYKGGFIKDVDLFATPTTEVRLGGHVVAPDTAGVLRVQLKLRAANDAKTLSDWVLSDQGNILISLDESIPQALEPVFRQGKFFHRGAVREWIAETPEVRKWLDRSLDWLPLAWRR